MSANNSVQKEIKAVLWDFGGVLTTSPFEAFNRFEAENGFPKDIIRTINSTNPDTNAWAQLESAAILVDEFDSTFADEATSTGIRDTWSRCARFTIRRHTTQHG